MTTFPTTPVLDSCLRTENPLSDGGAWGSFAAGQLRGIGTSATSPAGGGFASSRWTLGQYANAEAYATLVGATPSVTFYTRAAADASTYYSANFTVGSEFGEIHDENGFLANIDCGRALVIGDVVGMSAIGTLLTAWFNGADAGHVTSSTHASGYIAVAVNASDAVDGFKNFGGGAQVTFPKVTDLADIAAAQAAGYIVSRRTRAELNSLEYVTTLTTVLSPPFGGQATWAHAGSSFVSSAAADTAAVTALNAARRHRYAGSPGALSGSAVVPNEHGDLLVVDQS